MIFRKRFNLPSGALLFAESLTKISKQTVNFSNIPKKPFPLTPSKKYLMIEEFKDELKSLKKIFNEIKKLELLTEQEINEIKNDTKRKLNMLDDEINDILEKLDVDLTTLITRCKFFEKPFYFECVEKRKRVKHINNNKKKKNKWNKKIKRRS